MGICDSASNTESSPNLKPKKVFFVNNDTTGILAKYNIENDNIDLLRKKNNGYILPIALAKRDQIEKYYNIKEKLLGEGAFGQVCIGEKKGIKYAIKKIKKNKLTDLKSILLEAEISLSILHENIITYYEIYEDQEYISYVMDLGEGGDLFDFITRCPLGHLPADITIDLLIQILGVVDYLHSVKRIIHRDLKPENFMIKINILNKPQIKLIDFGYLEKVDEWAIGVIMYNMLTGFEPFSGKTPSEIKDKILFSQINFEEIEDNELREINKKLLNRYVAKRITSKEALIELKKIKIERDNYKTGQKRMNKKTPSIILNKEIQETREYMSYWDTISSRIHTGFDFI